MYKSKPIKNHRRGYNSSAMGKQTPLTGQPAHSQLEIRNKFEFLNHVVMIWLERATFDHRSIVMPDVILKSKAREVANLLNIDAVFMSSSWLRQFKLTMEESSVSKIKPKRQNTEGYCHNNKTSMIIADIVQEEWGSFFGDDKSCMIDKRIVQKIQKDLFKHGFREEDEPSGQDVLNSPIESIDEALDCLRLLENYALFIRDLKPMGLIADIENILLEEGS